MPFQRRTIHTPEPGPWPASMASTNWCERRLARTQPATATAPSSSHTQFLAFMARMLAPKALSRIVSGSIPIPVARMNVHQEISVRAQ